MPSPRKGVRAKRSLATALEAGAGLQTSQALGNKNANDVLGLALHGSQSPGRAGGPRRDWTCPIGAKAVVDSKALINTLGIDSGAPIFLGDPPPTFPCTTPGLAGFWDNEVTTAQYGGIAGSGLLTGYDDRNLHSKAVARLRVDLATAPADLADEWIYIDSADGTARTYVFKDGGGGAAGDELSAAGGHLGSKEVRVPISGLPSVLIPALLGLAFDSPNGHGVGAGAKITFNVNPGGANGYFTLEQQVAGTTGNTAIVTNVANAHMEIPTSFYGGLGAISDADDYKIIQLGLGMNVLTSMHMTNSTKVLIFSANGPRTKYIPSMEYVSAGFQTDFFLFNTADKTVAPPYAASTVWGAGEYFSVRIYGILAADDKLHIGGTSRTTSFAGTTFKDLNLDGIHAIGGTHIDDGATVSSSGAAARLLDRDGVIHHDADVTVGNDLGFAIGWNRGSTSEASFEGWVIRLEKGPFTFHP